MAYRRALPAGIIFSLVIFSVISTAFPGDPLLALQGLIEINYPLVLMLMPELGREISSVCPLAVFLRPDPVVQVDASIAGIAILAIHIGAILRFLAASTYT